MNFVMIIICIMVGLFVVGLMVFGLMVVFVQDFSYRFGMVWNFFYIKVEFGQFENYMDFLAKIWKKFNEFGKREGNVVFYYVFQVNNLCEGEFDLILVIEFKDYLMMVQQFDVQKRFEVFMVMDQYKMDVVLGDCKVMCKLVGSMELQELVLK